MFHVCCVEFQAATSYSFSRKVFCVCQMAMTDFEFVSSSKNTQMLIHESYLWTVKNVRKDGISVWRCTARNSHKCTAVLHTKVGPSGEMQRVMMTEHNHDSSPEEVVRIRADSAVRKAAVDAPYECPQNIIADTVSVTPVVHHVNLDEAHLRRTVRSARKRSVGDLGEHGGVYTSLQDLVIPQDLLVNRGDSLLLADSGPSDTRIVAFGARRHLHLLHEAGTILADGTFQIVPNLWKQQYTVHCSVRGYNVPVLFFLLPGKTRAMYEHMLGMMQDLVGSDLHVPWLVDFEAAMINAHHQVFTGTHTMGCFFHLTQSIHRKVDSMGYRERYSHDVEFRRRVTALSSLAFLPLNVVARAFDSLKMSFPLEERAIPDYFEWTYIGTDREESTHPNDVRHAALFPPAFWSVHGRHQFCIPMTTNACESFHHHQQASLHRALHPTVPQFLRDLHRQVSKADLHVAAMQAGHQRVPSRTLRRKAEKFIAIVRGLTDANLMEVLSQITHVRLNTGDFNGGFRILTPADLEEPAEDVPLTEAASPSHDAPLHGELEEAPPAEVVPVLEAASSSAAPPRFEEFQEAPPVEVVPFLAGASSSHAVPLHFEDFEEAPQAGAGSSHDEEASRPPLPFGESEFDESVAAPVVVASAPPAGQIPRTPVVPLIEVRDAPQWLASVGYSQGRHGPHKIEELQTTILRITAGRLKLNSKRARGSWCFQRCLRQTTCQGCRGLMAKGCPRLAWDPSVTNVDTLRSLPGYSAGNWHIACAILTSKVPTPRNCLKEIDLRVVGMLTGATDADAPTIEAMAQTQYVFLRAVLGV